MGICMRSGKKMRLRDLVKDGFYPWLLVAPEWKEERHPQEKLKPFSDPIALKRPAPDNETQARVQVIQAVPPATFDPLGVSRHLPLIFNFGDVTARMFTNWTNPTSANSAPGGTVAWVNPDRILSSNDSFAQAVLNAVSPGPVESAEALSGYGFGFAFSAADVITGIEVGIEGQLIQGNWGTPRAILVLLGDGATFGAMSQLGTNKTLQAPGPPIETLMLLGGSSDLWGMQGDSQATLRGNLNFATFGVAMYNVFGLHAVAETVISIDNIKMRVYLSGAGVSDMGWSRGFTKSFLTEILGGVHDFTADTFKVALYTNTAALDKATAAAYSATNEISGGGYSAGGVSIAATINSAGAMPYLDFADADFTNVTASVRGALIYNSSKSNKAVAVLDFGMILSPIAQNVRVEFPIPGTDTAFLRVLA